MTIELYWGSGSPYSWRVQLALEYKRLPYESHQLQFSKQEHKSPQMLRMNPRGRVPVLKDGGFIVFESLACLLYLDRRYPEPPLFGRTPEEAGTIMRVICEYQAYAESQLTQIVSAVFFENMDERVEEIIEAKSAIIAARTTTVAKANIRRIGRIVRSRVAPSPPSSPSSPATGPPSAWIRRSIAVRRISQMNQTGDAVPQVGPVQGLAILAHLGLAGRIARAAIGQNARGRILW